MNEKYKMKNQIYEMIGQIKSMRYVKSANAYFYTIKNMRLINELLTKKKYNSQNHLQSR